MFNCDGRPGSLTFIARANTSPRRPAVSVNHGESAHQPTPKSKKKKIPKNKRRSQKTVRSLRSGRMLDVESNDVSCWFAFFKEKYLVTSLGKG